MKKTSEWARELEPEFGFEHALLRNLTQMSNLLRVQRSTEDIASIARGAIQFVVTNHEQPPSDIGTLDNCQAEANEFHALGKAFIASYAIHEISVRLGEPVAYHHQPLPRRFFVKLSG